MPAANGLRHPASASCLGRHARLAGRCPNNSSLFPPLAAVVVVSEPRFHREKLLTEAGPSVKMRLSRPAGRDKREISIEVPLKNSQSEAETIQIVLLFI